MVSEIPPFDLALAYELYTSLLKPVEAGWKPAKSLIVVTNGALGELAAGPAADRAGADRRDDHADVRRLSQCAVARPHPCGDRDPVGLGARHLAPPAAGLAQPRQADRLRRSLFQRAGSGRSGSEARSQTRLQVAAAAAETDATADVATRGVPLKRRASPHTEEADTAELAMLPRLPDTRLELMAMAKALDVDPAKALYLGKDANEQKVETLDLSHYRIVAFATHGLVPGDIDGLTQPALALTAPDVAGVKGDGLLTMEKILALKLDADWVVLSACNTAAGAGAGAEAASGLGSAFFYAGTRALLVTNWSVQSTSARELITDLFRRQGADPTLSRSEALRQAMMALLDGPGSVDEAGRTVFSYAHPLFWAPYSVIGDGGGS